MVARVYLLNGASSAGKTTTATAMQELCATPLLRIGIDDLFASVPDPWGGHGRHTQQGFHYLDLPDGRGVRIGYGADGWRMLQGSHRAVRAYVEAGTSVVVDEMMLSQEVYADWLVALDGIPTTWVRVSCPLDVGEARERRRRQRTGLARGTSATVHAGVAYDLELDTSTLTPTEAATRVLGAGSA